MRVMRGVATFRVSHHISPEQMIQCQNLLQHQHHGRVSFDDGQTIEDRFFCPSNSKNEKESQLYHEDCGLWRTLSATSAIDVTAHQSSAPNTLGEAEVLFTFEGILKEWR